MKNWILSATCLTLLTACQSIPHSVTQPVPLITNLVNDVTTEQAQARPNLIDFEKIKQQQHRPVVALVLGSGGARGYAHIGAIQVLEEHGIRPDFIVGTSAGSIVGALYASGKTPEQIREIALNMKVQDVREITLRKNGFLDGAKVEHFINDQIGNLPLEKMKIPLFVVATELKQGKKVVFNYGNTGQAVRASVSIPSMFVPTKIGKDEYVDGGLVSPVPVNVARELGADIIIAVDILAQPMYTETSNVWGLFNQNINIMQGRLAEEELKDADIVIQPDLREKAHIFDVKGREMTMQAGVDAAKEKLANIQGAIQNKTKQTDSNQQDLVLKMNSSMPSP